MDSSSSPFSSLFSSSTSLLDPLILFHGVSLVDAQTGRSMRFLTIKLHLLLLMTIDVGEAHKHTLGGRPVVGDFFHTVSQSF